MFAIREILEITSGKIISGNIDQRVSGVSVDSRSIEPNQLFVAIRGARFDGHDFINQAGQRGARCILVDDHRYLTTSKKSCCGNTLAIIKVKNTTRALGALAHRYRRRFSLPVIAVTGSSGKTTTKEMLSAILAQRFRVLRNFGTENNHIGVPLTIFKLRRRHEVAIVELGANHLSEIERLSWIVQPQVAVITNIGPSHLEFLKSRQGVFKAKLEVIKHLTSNGKVVLNADDDFLARLSSSNFKIISFGFSQDADFRGRIIEQTEKNTKFLLKAGLRISLQVLGRHNVYNALASIAVARSFGISYREIKEALACFSALPLRMQMFNIGQIKIINDCYNSNPDSFKSALDFLRGLPNQKRKIIVCADMLELGSAAERLHLEMGRVISRSKINFLITVGPLAEKLAHAAQLSGMPQSSIRTCRKAEQAANYLRNLARAQDIVLIKGSRAMKLENVVGCFTGFFTP